jgi:hypothetical protein
MKVKKNGKTIIINPKLAERYVSLGYEVVKEKETKTEEKPKPLSDGKGEAKGE